MPNNSQVNDNWGQFSTLLLSSYPVAESTLAPNIDSHRLKKLLALDCGQGRLLEVLQGQLSVDERLSSQHYAVLKFVDQLFDNYCRNSKLADELTPCLVPLRVLAVNYLLQQQMPWHEDGELSCTLELINKHAIGWQPEFGRAADRFKQTLNMLLVTASDAEVDASVLAVSLKQFFDRERQRINKLERRLCDTEKGMLHAQHAKQLSARTLNRQMSGKKLPAAISCFLQGPWRESMQLLIINDGESGESWSRLLLLTETIIWSFQPYDHSDLDYRQQLYRSIAGISEDIREVTIGLHYSSKQDDELAVIESEHLKVLKGEQLNYQSFQLVDNHNPLLNAQTSISKGLIKQALGCNEGQWFIDQSGRNPKRIKLMAKISDTQQFLFSNFLGIKAAQYSVEEFAYLLSAKTIVPLNTRDHFQVTAEKIIVTLQQLLQKKQWQVEQKIAYEQEALHQKKLAREAAREKALQEVRALAEAQKTAQREGQRKNQLLKKQQVQHQHENTIRSQLDKLNVGTIIVFYNNNNKQQQQKETCKLAAVIQSSGEHIFVNRQGIKYCSLNLESLTAQLLVGDASIIELGSSFENTLETVVNNLRTRKNHE